MTVVPREIEDNAYAPFFGGGGWAGDNTEVMKVSEEFAAYVSSYTLEWE